MVFVLIYQGLQCKREMMSDTIDLMFILQLPLNDIICSNAKAGTKR